jgi:hypothetical protein
MGGPAGWACAGRGDHGPRRVRTHGWHCPPTTAAEVDWSLPPKWTGFEPDPPPQVDWSATESGLVSRETLTTGGAITRSLVLVLVVGGVAVASSLGGFVRQSPLTLALGGGGACGAGQEVGGARAALLRWRRLGYIGPGATGDGVVSTICGGSGIGITSSRGVVSSSSLRLCFCTVVGLARVMVRQAGRPPGEPCRWLGFVVSWRRWSPRGVVKGV